MYALKLFTIGVVLLDVINSIQSVQCCYTVCFSHCWIVESGVYKVADGVGGALLGHYGLPDMNDFCGVVSEAMNTQQFQAVWIEE